MKQSTHIRTKVPILHGCLLKVHKLYKFLYISETQHTYMHHGPILHGCLLTVNIGARYRVNILRTSSQPY